MPRLKNISPLGDLNVPDLRRVVAAGDVVEITEDMARVAGYANAADLASALLDQPTNWAAAPAGKKE